MTRQDFIDDLIIKGFPENEIKYKLRVRDDFKDIGTEEKDIEAMMEKSKNYKKSKIITPFGECIILVPRELVKEHFEYIRYMKGFSIIE